MPGAAGPVRDSQPFCEARGNTDPRTERRIGTTSGTPINLEDCSSCGIQGWGWQDNGYGAGVLGDTVQFASAGLQKLRVQTRGELKRLQQELGTTTLYVTHDQGEAMTLGRRVALLRAGRIEQVAPPLELYRRPRTRFAATFVGSPTINLWPVGMVDGRLEVLGVEVAVGPEVAGALRRAARVEIVDVEDRERANLTGQRRAGEQEERQAARDPGWHTPIIVTCGTLAS